MFKKNLISLCAYMCVYICVYVQTYVYVHILSVFYIINYTLLFQFGVARAQFLFNYLFN